MKAAYDEYITSFLAKEPRVTAVNIEAQPFVSFADTLNVRLSAKTPPNISWINASVGPLYVKSGKLVDLTPTINATPGFDVADFGDASLAPWKNGNQLVALPFTNASNVVFYNKDIFAKAGVPTPLELSAQSNWTWASMRETAKTLVDKQAARYGLLLNNNIFTNGFRNLIDIYAPVRRRAVERRRPDVRLQLAAGGPGDPVHLGHDLHRQEPARPGRAGGLDGGHHRHGAGPRQRLRHAGRAAVRLGRRGGARRSQRLRAVAGAERHRGLVGRAQCRPGGGSSWCTR